jgi:hypothetical protein
VKKLTTEQRTPLPMHLSLLLTFPIAIPFEVYLFFIWATISFIVFIPVYNFVRRFYDNHDEKSNSIVAITMQNEKPSVVDVLFDAIDFINSTRDGYLERFQTFDSSYLALRIARRVETIQQNPAANTLFALLDDFAKDRSFMREEFNNRKVIVLQDFPLWAKSELREYINCEYEPMPSGFDDRLFPIIYELFETVGRDEINFALSCVLNYVVLYNIGKTPLSRSGNSFIFMDRTPHTTVFQKPDSLAQHSYFATICASRWPIDFPRPELVSPSSSDKRIIFPCDELSIYHPDPGCSLRRRYFKYEVEP